MRTEQPMSGESDNAISPFSTPPSSSKRTIRERRRDTNALVFSDDDEDTLCADTQYTTSLGTMLQNLTLGTPRIGRSRQSTVAVDNKKKGKKSRAVKRNRAAISLPPAALTPRDSDAEADSMDWMPSTPHGQRKQPYRDTRNIISRPPPTSADIPMSGSIGATGLFRVPPSFHNQNPFGQTYLTDVMAQQQEHRKRHGTQEDGNSYNTVGNSLITNNDKETGLEKLFQQSFQIRDSTSITARVKQWFSS
ncbi:hypothetical protein BDF19DRAFT_432350 [Syncephalis fuscata]|nr:hypothetical protein BDF19DRAFT_432350 [Syncephalis fuscata]